MSVERQNNRVTGQQIDLFDLDGEPTITNETPNTAEISPSAEFSNLTGGQVPINYGLDTDEKIIRFIKENQGQSRMNISFALAALTREQDAKNEPEYSWQKRSDLR